MPLSGANSGGSMRGYGGRESMTPNHRENVKVAVKDSRPLNDKAYQVYVYDQYYLKCFSTFWVHGTLKDQKDISVNLSCL